MTPLVQARISYAIKLTGILVAVGGVIGAAWTALNTTGIFTPVTIALFILFSLVALITALQEFIKVNPLTQIIEGDAGVQAQAAVTGTLDEVHQLLIEIKDVVTSFPQPQASSTMTTTPAPESGTSTPSVTTTATVGDVSTAPVIPPVTPDPTVDSFAPPIVDAPQPPVAIEPTQTPDVSQNGLEAAQSASSVPVGAVVPDTVTLYGATYARVVSAT